jgi:outer membrane protein assembly factor BamB
MKNSVILGYLIVCISLGCCKEQQPNTNSIGPNVVWKTSFGNGLTSTMNPIVYKNFVVYSAYDSSNLKHKFIAFNKETGVKAWEWKNKNQPTGYLGVQQQFVKDNILVMPLSGRPYQVVAINLDDGTQLWHTTLSEGGSFQMVGCDEKVFHIRSSYDKMKEEIFVTNIRTGNWQSVYTATNVDGPIFIRGMRSYKGTDNKNYLTFLVSKYKDFTFQETSFTLFKYDVDSNKMVFQKTLDFIDKKNTSPFLAAANSNKFWLEGSPVYSLHEADGEKILSITPPMPEALSGKINVWMDKIFMPRTVTLMCYDGTTGKQLWSDDGTSSGNTDRFQVYNSVLYFASRGNGLLHAFDVQTGKRIWKVESPDIKHDAAGFDAVVTVDSVAGKVYTATYLSAVCYKAAQ